MRALSNTNEELISKPSYVFRRSPVLEEPFKEQDSIERLMRPVAQSPIVKTGTTQTTPAQAHM